MKLQYVGVIDEFYGYAVGLILFAATVKFMKLLRFNNRFQIVLLTLKRCWTVKKEQGNVTPVLLEHHAMCIFFRIYLDSWVSFSSCLWLLCRCFT